MPIFHFNVFDGAYTPDKNGHHLLSLADAKREAVLLSVDLISDMGARFWDAPDWKMDVTDESGQVLFSLAFSGEMLDLAERSAKLDGHLSPRSGRAPFPKVLKTSGTRGRPSND